MNNRGIKKPSVLATIDERRYLDSLSKAALLDLAVSLAGRIDEARRAAILVEEVAIVCGHRGDVVPKGL